MSLFHWAMKTGAAILFVVSLLILATSVLTLLMSAPGGGTYSSFAGELSPKLPQVWFILLGIVGALSSSALPFFGACLLYRADLALGQKGAAE